MGSNPVLSVLDFFDAIVDGKPNARENITVLIVYSSLLLFVTMVWHHFSDKDFSFVLTIAGILQGIAFFLLLHKMRISRSAAGISSKTLQMYLLMLCFRLTSTLVKNGYLPVDSTGDWLYQASDISSLILCFQLLFFVHKRFKTTYQEELDTMPIWNAVPAIMLLGYLVHGHLNHSLFFDTVWAIGLYLDSIAMLPQLWMLVAKGGEVEALTSHFVALMFFSRCLTWMFWYTGFPELAPSDGSFNKVGWMIMIAHTLQLLFSGDFMYHYFMWTGLTGPCRQCVKGGNPAKGMVLPIGTHDI